MILRKEGRPSGNGPTPETRRLVLERDRYRCVRCGRSLMAVRYSIHHRRLRSHPFAGLHEACNLISLCGSGTQLCHGWVHVHPREAMENGWIVSGFNPHPEQVPVKTTRGLILLDTGGGVAPARAER